MSDNPIKEELPEPVKKDLRKLARGVWAPVPSFVFSLPWVGRCSILLAVTMIGGFIKFHEPIQRWSLLTRQVVRVVTFGKEKIPIATDHRKFLNRQIDNLTRAIYADLNQKGGFAGQPWTTAQIIVAVAGKEDIDAKKAVSYFRSQEDPNLHCWRKWPQPLYPPHIGVSSWALLAMARLHEAATAEEIGFLLKNQSENKWWPIYPSDISDENASTYATAMAVWALYEQLHTAKVPDGDGKIQAAITRGAAWLYDGAGRNARWKDYPSGREMLSISGLVLHVLHLATPFDMTDINQSWIRNLPGAIPLAKDFESSNKTIVNAPSGPVQTDETRYYILALSIAATIDAYSEGGFLERAYALSWLEKVTEFPGPLGSVTGGNDDWITAELLIALRPLR